ncbi:hypothetical protein SCLCIDRAFT_1224522 [Scleroderma citrinum Foug A]|uniref:Uncharacterized protein n=1 Tax=Scleroderma citrinum Foug A TaxID=1036808 RepID=A0A0C3D5S6_9AGAM|nr:hypothetical protein SCLCIDRAFT_1224522 [Scleroderma citrinum Foug A]
MGTWTSLALKQTRIDLQTHQIALEHLEREANRQTHLVGMQDSAQMSRTVAGTMRIGRAYARTCQALGVTWKWRKTRVKTAKSTYHGTNGCANESDESRNHAGTPNICTHAITPVYEAENISTHSNEPQTRNSPASTGKPHKGETDSMGSHANASNGRTDIPNIETHAKRTEIHSDSPNGAGDHTDGSCVRMDMHNAGGVRQTPDKPSDYRNHPDKSGKRTDGHSVANARTPANKAEMRRSHTETLQSVSTESTGPGVDAAASRSDL